MKFDEAVRTVFGKYATFDGRAGRSEFWYWALFTFLVSLVFNVLSMYVASSLGYVGNLFSLATIIPSVAVGARRMHDIGKSGWWQLVNLVPVLGWLYFIYLAAQPSGSANAYGTGPAAAATA